MVIFFRFVFKVLRFFYRISYKIVFRRCEGSWVIYVMVLYIRVYVCVIVLYIYVYRRYSFIYLYIYIRYGFIYIIVLDIYVYIYIL